MGGGGRPLMATGGHKGQIPRTDSGRGAGIYSFNAARTLKATLVWGINENIYHPASENHTLVRYLSRGGSDDTVG